MALFWQQMAGIGHDVGHNGISHNRHIDGPCGILIGNFFMGISMAWWKRNHNVHHIVCNSIENDPDIQHPPIFAVTSSMFGKYFSTFYQKFIITDGFFVSYQHWLFYPVMAVARLNLYAQGWILVLSKEKVFYRQWEIFGLLLFQLWLGLLLYTLPTNFQRLVWFSLSHALAGILHVQICISHFAMDTYHGQAYNNKNDEWFRMQLRTTMNVDCPWYMDWFYLGLQFQIEHHLFPRLPRHSLREARKYVKKLCEKHDIHYHEPGFFQANVELVQCLHKTAMEARMLKMCDGGFYVSQLYGGLNAQG